jgi:RNA recognition motif-containing protein
MDIPSRSEVGGGGMKILIANLPCEVTEPELLELLKPYHKRDGLRLQIVGQAPEDPSREFYAIADINHERLAEKAVKKLNGKMLRGRKLRLREFQHRSYSNERRALGWRNRAWNAKERRLEERRRQTQKSGDPLDAVLGKEESSGIRVHEIRIAGKTDNS